MSVATFALLLAAAAPERGEIYGALWDDIRLNAWIGNGNHRVSLDWVTGDDPDHPPDLRIADLKCADWLGVARCRFDLLREADPASTAPLAGANRLKCTALLKRYKQADGSRKREVIHRPPEGAGHSRTTMRCRVDKA